MRFLGWLLLTCPLFLSQRGHVNAFSLRQTLLSQKTVPSNSVGPFQDIQKAETSRDGLIRCGSSASESSNEVSPPSRPRRFGWKSLLAVALSSVALTVLPSQNLLGEYRRLLSMYPLRTKVATGALLAVVGDALAQARLKAEKYDSYRAASFAAFDSCYRVFQHIAFPLLVGRCRGRFLGSIVASAKGMDDLSQTLVHYLAATEQTLAYQLCVVPLLYYPVFFTFTGFMQGLNLQETLARMKKDFIPCWKRNMLFWIPMQFYMFGFLESKWQIPFSCVMGILWSTILSAFAGRAATVTCVADECDIE